VKAEAGWGAAALVAAAAVVGIGSQSGGKSPAADAGGGKQGQARVASKTEVKTAFDRGPCGDLEGTIRTFLLAKDSESAAPVSCYEGASEKRAKSDSQESSQATAEYLKARNEANGFRSKASGLQYVIAILPDPLHTHFSLSFDRQAEAIQQGAQDEGYFYDSSWLPWETEEQPLALLADQDKADDQKKAREEQPGVLLFRKRQPPSDPNPAAPEMLAPYQNGLAVFIVGEEPTSGIHKHQFENAVAWIEALQPRDGETSAPPKNAVKILGPSFSGSLPSLAELLAESGRSSPIASLYSNAPDRTLAIYSGGITGNVVVDWFNNRAPRIGKVRFRSFQQDGDQVLNLYRKYLYDQHFDVSHLAIISEDETAYGSNSGEQICATRSFEMKERAGPTCVYYPRDLSALRDAYQRQGVFNATSTPQSADASQKQLASDLADPEGKEHDTIRNYSGGQTALSQEAVLKQMVSVLRAHQAEYLVLRSSNPLDQLFLSYFLRQTYPEGRVVIASSDLLLRRENGAQALSGIMTLTNYPLQAWGYHWTTSAPGPPYLHSHRVFSQEGAEGTYIASRFLLHPIDCAAQSTETFLPPTCNDLAIDDYAPPFWVHSSEPKRPSTWVSVLGKDGFWPIAALDRSMLSAKDEHVPGWRIFRIGQRAVGSAWNLTKVFPGAGTSEAGHGGFADWPAMPASMKVCMLALLTLSIFHLFFCCWWPSLTVKPVHRAHFAWVPNREHKGWDISHSVLIVMGSVVLVLIPTFLAWGYGEMSPDGEPVPGAGWYRAFLALSWLLAALAVGRNAWVESKDFPRTKDPVSPPPIGERIVTACAKFLKLVRRDQEAWRGARQTTVHCLRAVWRPVCGFALAAILLYFAIDALLDQDFGDFNRIPAYWRSVNLVSGVSPLVPLLALAAGLYIWFWYSLQGLALLGDDRPVLPSEKCLRLALPGAASAVHKKAITLPSKARLFFSWGKKLPLLSMFSDELAADPIEALCDPFAAEIRRVGISVFVIIAAVGLLLGGGEPPIRTLGPKSYSVFVCLFMDLCISLMLANAWQLMRVWIGLNQLLVFLDRVPLRRTLMALQDISWGSIWKLSGSVLDLRYRLLSRQLETLTHLQSHLQEEKEKQPDATRWLAQVNSTQGISLAFAAWYAESWNNWKDRDLSKLCAFQHSVAETAAMLFSETLVKQWMQEKESLTLNLSEEISSDEKDGKEPNPVLKLPPYIRDAEELVCLVYIGFVQNILGRMRTLGLQMLWLFVAVTASVATYPFDPRPGISAALLVLFLALGAAIVIVYSQMHRDAALSLITNTNPGELGTDFWFKLLTFSAGPVLGLAATIFPELTGSLFSWLQPGISSLK
jgi:hypothetical protein